MIQLLKRILCRIRGHDWLKLGHVLLTNGRARFAEVCSRCGEYREG
jgi:hypothetical protein